MILKGMGRKIINTARGLKVTLGGKVILFPTKEVSSRPSLELWCQSLRLALYIFGSGHMYRGDSGILEGE